MRTRLEQNDPYLVEISRKWQDGIVRLVRQMPVADFSKTALGFATAA
jgi:predicted proteasome-type protease